MCVSVLAIVCVYVCIVGSLVWVFAIAKFAFIF